MSTLMDLTLNLLNDMGQEQANMALQQATPSTRLFGQALDSMGMVFLVADLEALISEDFNLDITLADDRAMSQKTSPFRSVETLVNYMQQLIDEAKAQD
ncbi:MAG: hypothetical protein ACRCYV_02105 [Aeromonas sp.]